MRIVGDWGAHPTAIALFWVARSLRLYPSSVQGQGAHIGYDLVARFEGIDRWQVQILRGRDGKLVLLLFSNWIGKVGDHHPLARLLFPNAVVVTTLHNL